MFCRENFRLGQTFTFLVGKTTRKWENRFTLARALIGFQAKAHHNFSLILC